MKYRIVYESFRTYPYSVEVQKPDGTWIYVSDTVAKTPEESRELLDEKLAPSMKVIEEFEL